MPLDPKQHERPGGDTAEQRPVRTSPEATKAAGGVDIKEKLIRLLGVAPQYSPEQRVDLLTYIEGFIDFVKEFEPVNLDRCSDLEGYFLLTSVYLQAQIKWSKDGLTCAATEQMDEVIMTDMSLHLQREFAEEVADLLFNTGTTDNLRHQKERLGTLVSEYIEHYKIPRRDPSERRGFTDKNAELFRYVRDPPRPSIRTNVLAMRANALQVVRHYQRRKRMEALTKDLEAQMAAWDLKYGEEKDAQASPAPRDD